MTKPIPKRKNKPYTNVCGRPKSEKQGGGQCGRPAGWGTTHVGEGACKNHGGQQPGDGRLAANGAYSQLKRSTIREKLNELGEQIKGSTDLRHELDLLRVLVIDYIDRYEAITESLLAWHNSFNDYWLQLAAMERKALTAQTPEEFRHELRQLQSFKFAVDASKPRKMLDITQAAGLIEKIGKIVSIIDKREALKKSAPITAETFQRILSEMTAAVVKLVEPDVVHKIDAEWEKIKFR